MQLPIEKNLLWERLYRVVDASEPARVLATERQIIPIKPELELELRRGEHGSDLRRVLILALNRSGEKVTQEEISLAADYNE